MTPTIHLFVIALLLPIVGGGCALAPDGLVRSVDQGIIAEDLPELDTTDPGAELDTGDTSEGQDADASSEDTSSADVTDSGTAIDMDLHEDVADLTVDLPQDVSQDIISDPGVSDEGADIVESDPGSPPVEGESCCYANGNIGCSDATCTSMVCALDPLCCLLEWDDFCAQSANTLCGECNLEVSGACCIANESPYCSNFDCMNTVCQDDPYCCNNKWDSVCANKASNLCSECDLSEAGDCCSSNGDPYCTELSCVEAVCAKDDYCCTGKWDTFCANCAKGETTFGGTPCDDVVEACGCVALSITHEDLAEHWSPVWYQDTDDTDAQADYITAFDFDGDFISKNNWENLHTETADLNAVIYWSVVETETHWFILYADFHPRDWTEDCDPNIPFVSSPCHENDMEGAMVVVKKDGTDWGQFQVLYTEAHNDLHIFTNDPAISAGSTTHLESAPVTFEGGSHPELYVESKGHGVCALLFDGDSHCEHPVTPGGNYFPGGDGIIYRFNGAEDVPEGGNDQDVGYSLFPLETTLWPRRFDICNDGCTFDGNLNYMGVNFGKSFDGDTWKDDAANPPWAWDDPDDGEQVQRGDFFFRPAHTYIQHLNGQGSVSEIYLHNPYFFSIPGQNPL
jgi:hypothetical protein